MTGQYALEEQASSCQGGALIQPESSLEEVKRELVGILRRATRVAAPVTVVSGVGLHHQTVDDLAQLARHLAHHPRFEQHNEKHLRKMLANGVASYVRCRDRSNRRAVASSLVDELASEPMTARVYLGVRGLALPDEVDTGLAVLTPLANRPALEVQLARQPPAVERANVYCEVSAVGGKAPRVIERARSQALVALALARQELRAAHPALTNEELQFDPDGTAVCQFPHGQRSFHSKSLSGTPLELPATPPLTAQLAGTGPKIQHLAPEVRRRVETSLQWLDVAARPYAWRVGVPAIFAAMESLLVPERDVKDKGAVLAVRAVTLQLDVEGGFSDPGMVVTGYDLRSDLTHGVPLDDVVDDSAESYLRWARQWAFRVFKDFIEYTTGPTATRPTRVTRSLDDSELVPSVLEWFRNADGVDIVDGYVRAVGPPVESQSG